MEERPGEEDGGEARRGGWRRGQESRDYRAPPRLPPSGTTGHCNERLLEPTDHWNDRSGESRLKQQLPKLPTYVGLQEIVGWTEGLEVSEEGQVMPLECLGCTYKCRNSRDYSLHLY